MNKRWDQGGHFNTNSNPKKQMDSSQASQPLRQGLQQGLFSGELGVASALQACGLPSLSGPVPLSRTALLPLLNTSLHVPCPHSSGPWSTQPACFRAYHILAALSSRFQSQTLERKQFGSAQLLSLSATQCWPRVMCPPPA